jgi:hypothetical protein
MEGAQVTHAEIDAPAAVAGELGEYQLQDRAVPDRHEWFGEYERVGPQPRARAARQNDGAHPSSSVDGPPRCVKEVRLGDSTP